jgi:hypothetical protein
MQVSQTSQECRHLHSEDDGGRKAPFSLRH